VTFKIVSDVAAEAVLADALDDGGAARLRPGEMAIEVIDEHPGHMSHGGAFLALAFQPGDDQRAVADPELDPVPPRVIVGQHSRRLETEHIGQPSCRRRGLGVADGDPQPGRVLRLARRTRPPGAPGAEPGRDHSHPECAAALGAAGRDGGAHPDDRAAVRRVKPDVDDDVVD
jgi:hypothetical protein